MDSVKNHLRIKHLRIKQLCINQLTLFVNKALEPLEEEYFETVIRENAKSPLNKAWAKSQVLQKECSAEDFPELNNGHLEIIDGTTKYQIEYTNAPVMLNYIERKFGNGKYPRVSKSLSNQNFNERSNEMQQTIMNMRGKYDPEDIERMYGKDSYIYHCRNFIANPKNIEGIHKQHSKPPRAKFEAYSNTNPKPDSCKIQLVNKPKPKPKTKRKPTAPKAIIQTFNIIDKTTPVKHKPIKKANSTVLFSIAI